MSDELLKLLNRNPKGWTASELAQETSMALWRIQARLQDMQEAGLISCRDQFVYFAKSESTPEA